ncbi:MAG: hypothetical protein EBS90_11415, partial [Betaproteobacteria bacterium]|nr:hypothetical protein [Betaproteobacteria bacterium]
MSYELDELVVTECASSAQPSVLASKKQGKETILCSCDADAVCDCDCVKGVGCEAEVHDGTCRSLIAEAACSCSAIWLQPEADPEPLWEGFAYKPHQMVAIRWMLERESSTPSGGLLCDEMGLGKTMEILGLIKNSPKRHNLLLCPKAVVAQWRAAAGRSRFNVLEVRGQAWTMTTPYRSGQPMLFVTNYEKLVSKKVFGFHWHRVILDEAQRVRVRSSKIWGAINAMRRHTTWCVSATPVVNSEKDIKALFELVGYKKEELAILPPLMASACLHRSMAEMRPVLKELPCAPTVVKEFLDFETEDEAEFYRGIQGLIMRRWRSLERDQSPVLFSLIMRLRQISLHPQVYINARKREWVNYGRDDWVGASTKFNALRRKIETASGPSRWIVFCQFHDEMEMLQSFLEKVPAVNRIQMYHGGMTDKAKEAVIAGTFGSLDDGHEVLLL